MTSIIKSKKVKAVNVTGTITRTNGTSKVITAPTESGYKFVSWVGIVTTGWYGNVFFQNPIDASTNIFVNNVGVLNNNQGGFTATALYQAD